MSDMREACRPLLTCLLKKTTAMEEKRKSTRGFNLEKPKKRTFNLEKEPVVDPPTESGNGGMESTGSGKKWIWIIVVLLLVILGVFVFRGCGNKASNEETKTLPESVSDSTSNEQQIADSVKINTERLESSETTQSPDDNQTSGSAPQSQNMRGSNMAVPTNTAVETAGSNMGPTSDTETEARKVITGVYGNGSVRRQKLGASYAKIQNRVNEIYHNGYRH